MGFDGVVAALSIAFEGVAVALPVRFALFAMTFAWAVARSARRRAPAASSARFLDHLSRSSERWGATASLTASTSYSAPSGVFV
jgi:hypothetical protein